MGRNCRQSSADGRWLDPLPSARVHCRPCTTIPFVIPMGIVIERLIVTPGDSKPVRDVDDEGGSDERV